MIALIDYAMAAGLTRLIFISTTSVFGNYEGTVTNKTAPSPVTDSGKAHETIENHLFENYPQRSKILRPSGLIGPNDSETGGSLNAIRHPIYSLCSKVDIPKGNDPVNLVHQSDVIKAIHALLTQQTITHAFNISALDHPSRQTYYQWAAKQVMLPTPTFADDTKKRQLGKLIDASITFAELGISPNYASPFDML
jgi:nucleoside-diphosphate-sugar epimerase